MSARRRRQRSALGRAWQRARSWSWGGTRRSSRSLGQQAWMWADLRLLPSPAQAATAHKPASTRPVSVGFRQSALEQHFQTPTLACSVLPLVLPTPHPGPTLLHSRIPACLECSQPLLTLQRYVSSGLKPPHLLKTIAASISAEWWCHRQVCMPGGKTCFEGWEGCFSLAHTTKAPLVLRRAAEQSTKKQGPRPTSREA